MHDPIQRNKLAFYEFSMFIYVAIDDFYQKKHVFQKKFPCVVLD